jgi:glycosyltransferase involved in cell wall biosynthesis
VKFHITRYRYYLVGKDLTITRSYFSINPPDGVTAVSEDLKATYAHFDIHKDIKVIPNFIDLNRFQFKS